MFLNIYKWQINIIKNTQKKLREEAGGRCQNLSEEEKDKKRKKNRDK